MSYLERHPNWQVRVSDMIREAHEKEFIWGLHDCVLFGSDALEAVFEESPLAYLRGSYHSAIGAKSVLTVEGCEEAVELFDRHCGERKPLVYARPGDIVAASPEKALYGVEGSDIFGPALGVCVGTRTFFLARYGVLELPTLQLTGHCYHGIYRQGS